MTATGTRTYLLGNRDVGVIDPGPDDPAHVAAILGALAPGARITHILVTHGHRDHSGAAPGLSLRTGAPVLAFGPATAGRSQPMAALAGRLEAGQGIDHAFAPDRRLAHGERVDTGEWAVTALHTPGHLSSHMVFALEGRDIVFTGDTVMGWSSTVISPPDGSVGAFLASLDMLLARDEDLYLPGHGAPVFRAKDTVLKQKRHRLAREAQIISALRGGARTIAEITALIYPDIPAALHRPAARTVLAHLIDLAHNGRVALPEGPLDTGEYRPR